MSAEGANSLSPRETHTAGANATSLTASTTFSEAPTLLTGDSRYTANTGGRSRQSWRNTTSNFRPSGVPGIQHRQSHGTSNSSPTDNGLAPQTYPPFIDIPAQPVTQPDEPRSFFDWSSNSDSDSHSDGEPVISRANSVRVQRPQIVEHHPSTSSSSLRVYAQEPGPTSHPVPSQIDIQPASRHSTSDHVSGEPDHLITNGLTEGNVVTTTCENDIPSALPSQRLASERSVRVARGGEAEPSLALPTAGGGFMSGQLEASQTGSPNMRRLGRFAADGLRSNPVNDAEIFHLHRAISAPPLPNRHPHRKVTIRPSDLVIAEAADNHRLFEESVVRTPYPTRISSIGMDERLAPSINAANTEKPLPPVKGDHDRFPSPSRAEVLYIQLALARHPSALTMVEIKVEDKRNFDDERLFRCIKQSYHKNLLGSARRLFKLRSLSSADFASSGSLFDSDNFIRHLNSPKLGHKRKSWLVWLRNQQQQQVRGRKSGGSSSVSGMTSDIRNSPYSPYSPSTLSPIPFLKMGAVSKAPPLVKLSFEFSVLRVMLIFLCVAFLSCLTPVLWVLFGFPGQSAAGPSRGGPALDPADWKADAEQRVLTGLVLGVLVFLLGSMGGVAWVSGSWMLL